MTDYLQQSYGLDESQQTQIRRLEEKCNRFEGLTMKLNWGLLTRRPAKQINDLLYYTNGELVGYLGLYIFNRKEAEISAMVHPAHWRQGIFSKLLGQARQILRRRSVPEMLFICEQGSESGVACLRAGGAAYEFSEYKMTLSRKPISPPPETEAQLRRGQVDDAPFLTWLDQLCFNIAPDVAASHVAAQIADETRPLWVIEVDQIPIGKIQVLYTPDETRIAGFCLLPAYRGRGYGRAILNQVVSQLVAAQKTPLSLEVAVKNEQALGLYRRCGFEVATAYDYYRLEV